MTKYNARPMGPRAEYREQQDDRVKKSPTLADKFPQLKSLSADLRHSTTTSGSNERQVKYTVNVEHTKSVFRICCPNSECVRGDFDLTKELADAIKKREKKASGELTCKGWQSRETIGKVHCNSVMSYKLTLT